MSVVFEPKWGFPPIIRQDDAIPNEKKLESRGFSTNIVSIGNIIDTKKRENLFIAFGNEEDNLMGGDILAERIEPFVDIKSEDVPKNYIRYNRN